MRQKKRWPVVIQIRKFFRELAKSALKQYWKLNGLRSLALLLLIICFSFSCARFKVETIKPDLIAKLKIGNSPGHLEGQVVNNVITNLPMTIPVRSDKLYASDLKNNVIKVFDTSGSLEYIIGTYPIKPSQKIKNIPIRLGGIGIIAPFEKDEVYIQNKITSKEILGKPGKENPYTKFSGAFAFDDVGTPPSVILHLNRKGVLQNVIGVSGAGTEPFRDIEQIYPDEDEQVYVVYRHAEELRMSLFAKGELKFTVREFDLPVSKSEEAKKMKVKLENIYPCRKKEFFLTSYSFYSKTDGKFKFRRIFKVENKDLKNEHLIKEIPDPNVVLFSVRKNGDFLLWETEESGNSIKLKLNDMNGNHYNNYRMSILLPRGNWRETYTDQEDHIYSLRLHQGHLELFRWN